MKYIVFRDESCAIFPDSTSHKEIAGNKPVKSAGFCIVETYRNNFDDICANVSCYGKSDSLNIESSPNDNNILCRMFRVG